MRIGRAFLTLAALGAVFTLAFLSAGTGEEEAAKKVPNDVGGGYMAYTTTRGTVAFSHLSHADAGFTCENCHDSIFPKKRGSFKMQDLYDEKACGKCHNGEMTGPKKPETVAFPVGMCNACHMPLKVTPYAPKSMPPSSFPHAKHTADGTKVEAGYACGTCHPKPFARKAGQVKMAVPHTTLCATCHDGKTVSPSGATAPTIKNCTKCHKKAA